MSWSSPGIHDSAIVLEGDFEKAGLQSVRGLHFPFSLFPLMLVLSVITNQRFQLRCACRTSAYIQCGGVVWFVCARTDTRAFLVVSHRPVWTAHIAAGSES